VRPRFATDAVQLAAYDRFDAVVLLSAPIDVILARAIHRANPFGSCPEDRTKIANDLTEFEPQLRAGADAEIVTTAPITEVVARSNTSQPQSSVALVGLGSGSLAACDR
jgi:hypothetical protein